MVWFKIYLLFIVLPFPITYQASNYIDRPSLLINDGLNEEYKEQKLQNLLQEVQIYVKNPELEPRNYGIDTYVNYVINKILNLVSFTKLINQIREGIATQTVCLTCRILTVLYTSASLSTYSTLFSVKTLCIVFKVQKSHICNDMIEQIQNVFDFLRFQTRLTPEEMCGVSIGLACASTWTEKLNWTLPLPAKETNMSIDLEEWKLRLHEEVHYFAQVTDVHMDPLYVPGANSNCNEPVCCRPSHGIADQIVEMAGLWGNYHGCDTPMITVHQTIDQLNKSSDRLEYILSTGDVAPHDIWNYRRSMTLGLIDVLEAAYKKTFSIPIYSAIGNHEAIPINSFSPSIQQIGRDDVATDWLYASLVHRWSNWIPEDSLEDFKKAGNYVVKVRKGFRIIGINTNYCARMNPWILYDTVDPGGVLKFLIRELEKAEREGDKVHLVGHIAPDHRECTQAWLQNFIRILTRFQDTVRAQFYGHNHRDEFRVYYSLENPDYPVGFALICPSLTSYSQTNPSFRIYKMNGEADLLDYETYFFNLTENQFRQNIDWKLEYHASYLLEADKLTPEAFDQFLKRLESDDELFGRYHKIYYSMSDADIAQTWDDHKKKIIIQDHRVRNPMTTAPFPFQE